MTTNKARVTLFVDTVEEREKLNREAKRFGLSLTEYLNRGLKVGLPVVKKALRKAQQEQKSITEKTVAVLNEE